MTALLQYALKGHNIAYRTPQVFKYKAELWYLCTEKQNQYSSAAVYQRPLDRNITVLRGEKTISCLKFVIVITLIHLS